MSGRQEKVGHYDYSGMYSAVPHGANQSGR